MSSPTQRSDVSKARREMDSPGLQKLLASPPTEQAEFWQRTANGIGGIRKGCPSTFPPDRVLNDVLGRFYDASEDQLSMMFKKVKGEKGERLGKEQVYDALKNHCGFFGDTSEQQAGMDNKEFKELCNIMQLPCSQEAFAHSVRHLRLGALLKSCSSSKTKLYSYDYDDTYISGSHQKSRHTEHHYDGDDFEVPVVAPQDQVHVKDFLFTPKGSHKGRVHWVHAHEIDIAMILALGQLYRMPSHVQGCVCHLDKAEPRLDIHQGAEGDDKFVWSSLLLPLVHLEFHSRQTLDRYNKWFAAQSKGDNKNEEPPRVTVTAVANNLEVLWSNSADQAQKKNVVITMTSGSTYVGNWSTDKEPRGAHLASNFFSSILASLHCCKRRDGYQPVSQDDTEQDLEADADPLKTPRRHSHDIEAHVDKVFKNEAVSYHGHRVGGFATHSTTFEESFEQIILQLGDDNSLLRMGDNTQLVTRMIVNRTADYLDVVCVYKAAIERMKFLMRQRSTADKDNIVAKISMARLELGHLLRWINPFVEQVLPDFEDVQKFAFTDCKTAQHIKNLGKNLRQFVPACTAQIEACESLIAEYDRAAGDKVNNILNILTVITFIVMPMQILTGLYGMNFKVMPELQWEYGYHYFYCLAATLTLVFSAILVGIYRVAT